MRLAAYVFFILLYLNTNVHTLKTLDNGPFTNFIRNFIDTLISFPSGDGNKNYIGLSPFVYVLSKLIGDMGYHKSKRLAKVLKILSKQNDTDIKYFLTKCKCDLDDQAVEYRVKFLKAMNAIFTPEQTKLFDDYIRELKKYAYDERHEVDIVQETRVILNYVILNTVLQMNVGDREDLREKMKKAVKEYKSWTASSLLLQDDTSDTSDEDGQTSDDDSYETLNNKIHMKLSKNASEQIVISV